MQRPIKTKQKNGQYLVILVLLVIFMATVGIKLLINTSIWISNITRGTNNSSSQKDVTILAPAELFDVPVATNSATLILSGQGTKGTDITVYVNDDPIDTQTLNSEDFETTVQLEQGSNSIYVESKDPKSNKIKDSDVYEITLISAKPSLSLSSPTDGQIVDSDSVMLEGTTDPDVSVQMNNIPVVVASDGTFSYAISLQSGENVLVITATDRAGNSEKVEMRVKREN